ncbi:clp1-like protein [Mycena maculata]|uniref:Clp1-like protein n=1 Tax=Mycena maculata TaxID=230809 RepID=A0AAD7MVR3_9AGAR|nr:clp1-like protein [Mycena maculata]
MFQVASHSSAFPHPHQHNSRSRYREEPPSPLTLPRTLTRPPFTPLPATALSSLSPDLAGLPPDFVRAGLRAGAAAMQAGIASLAPSHLPTSIPKDRLPPALQVPLRAVQATRELSLPTHVLALSPAPQKGARDEPPAAATLFPVHALVLAAHCAKLPALPPAAAPQQQRPAALALPLLPLALPSPPAFAILHAWMYTGRLDAALASLLPLPPPFLATLATSPQDAHQALGTTRASPQALHLLAAHLYTAAGGNLSSLMSHAGHVRDLWADMVALGVYDPTLWEAVDVCWEVVLAALNLAAQ